MRAASNGVTILTHHSPIFYVGGVAHEGDAIALKGHESDMIDVDKSLKKLHLSSPAVGGIALTYTNGPASLAMVGVISNKQTGFSTTMRFIDQSSQHTTSLHGANLLIGKPRTDSGFTSTTRFTPHIIVRNNSDLPVEVKPRIRYMLNGEAHTIRLDELSLFAQEVRELDLSGAIEAIGNHRVSDAGIEIKHSGQPGAVLAYAASIDQSGSVVFDVPIKDPESEMGFKGGSYPWNIEGDNRAVLHVKNIDDPVAGNQRQFLVKLHFEGGEYQLPVQIVEAGQTAEIDIKKLRDDQVKDSLGNVIPLNVTGGQLNWLGRGRSGDFIGRLVQYNPVTQMSASFSCVTGCNCDPSWVDSWLQPALQTGVVDDSFQIIGMELDQDCFGNAYGPYAAINTHFSSNNASVATVQVNQVTFVGPGTAQISGHWDAYTVTEGGGCDPELGCGHGRNTCPYQRAPDPVPAVVFVRPTVSSISPSKGLIGQPVNVTINGTGFAAGSTVSINSGTVNNVTIQSESEITANYTSNDNASGGNHRVRVTSNGQTSTDNVNFYVQLPTSLSVVPGSMSTLSCDSSSQNYGIKITVQYQVLDQNGDPILSAGMEPQEELLNDIINGMHFPDVDWRAIGPSGVSCSTSQFTDTNGKFCDAPLGTCGTVAFTQTETQLIRIVPLNQNLYTVRTNNGSLSSSASGAGSISNGSDIVRSRP